MSGRGLHGHTIRGGQDGGTSETLEETAADGTIEERSGLASHRAHCGAACIIARPARLPDRSGAARERLSRLAVTRETHNAQRGGYQAC